MQRKVDMVRAYGLSAAMAEVELEFLTPSGCISCIGGEVGPATLELARRSLKQQVRATPADCFWPPPPLVKHLAVFTSPRVPAIFS